MGYRGRSNDKGDGDERWQLLTELTDEKYPENLIYHRFKLNKPSITYVNIRTRILPVTVVDTRHQDKTKVADAASPNTTLSAATRAYFLADEEGLSSEIFEREPT